MPREPFALHNLYSESGALEGSEEVISAMDWDLGVQSRFGPQKITTNGLDERVLARATTWRLDVSSLASKRKILAGSEGEQRHTGRFLFQWISKPERSVFQRS